jgi:hypothetical protein
MALVKLKMEAKEIDNSFWTMYYYPLEKLEIVIYNLVNRIFTAGIFTGALRGVEAVTSRFITG